MAITETRVYVHFGNLPYVKIEGYWEEGLHLLFASNLKATEVEEHNPPPCVEIESIRGGGEAVPASK